MFDGLKINDDLQFCFVENGTFYDCPVADHPKQDFFVFLHNSGFYDHKYVKLQVPSQNYKALSINKNTNSLEERYSVINCFDQSHRNGTIVNQC